MRSWMTILVAGMVACGADPEGKSLVGRMPADASGVYALDTQGHRVDGRVQGDSFSLALTPGVPAIVLFEAGGLPHVLQFERDAAGNVETLIPDFTGEIDLGAVTLESALLRDGEAEEWAESENNPLDEVDSDDDGESDLDDEDDDDDGESDDEDGDDDGDGEDDDDQDLDSDDDGSPDCADDDDDDDGVDDEEDEDDGDEDEDGVPDDEDDDDDNDGEDDEDEEEEETESTDD
jgi:hypothetical protein